MIAQTTFSNSRSSEREFAHFVIGRQTWIGLWLFQPLMARLRDSMGARNSFRRDVRPQWTLPLSVPASALFPTRRTRKTRSDPREPVCKSTRLRHECRAFFAANTFEQVRQFLKLWLLCVGLSAFTVSGADSEHTYRVRGLFQPDRVDELKKVVEGMGEIKLGEVDYDAGEVTFVFDSAKLFPNTRFKSPEQLMTSFNQKLRQETKGTFEVVPRSSVPPEKLVEVKIPVLGLDCKGCSYGAYLAVYKIDGVERTTVSFRDGFVIARINPEKVKESDLEDALRKARVTLAGEVKK